MNPTSPTRHSLPYSPSSRPSISSAIQSQEPNQSSSSTTQESPCWTVCAQAHVPVYSIPENHVFKASFFALLQSLEVQLHNLSHRVSEIYGSQTSNNLQLFTTLAAFLNYSLPQNISLSFFASHAAMRRGAEEPFLATENPQMLSEQTHHILQQLTETITSLRTLLHQGLQLDEIIKRNPSPTQEQCAFLSALCRRLSPEQLLFAKEPNTYRALMKMSGFNILDYKNLLVCMVSAADPYSDMASQKAKHQFLGEAAQEFKSAQTNLVNQICHQLVRHQQSLPVDGKGILAICRHYCGGPTNLPRYLEKLSSWNNLIFFCLARIFLKDKGMIIPQALNVPVFVGSLHPYFPDTEPDLLLQALAGALITPQKKEGSHSTSQPSCIDVGAAIERFLSSITMLNSLLRGLFSLEQGKALAQQNIQKFHMYKESLLKNISPTKDMEEAIELSYAMCIEYTHNQTYPKEQLANSLKALTDLLKQAMTEAASFLMLHQNNYHTLIASEAIEAIVQAMNFDVVFPREIIESSAGTAAWQNAVQTCLSERAVEHISKDDRALRTRIKKTSVELTDLSLTLCKVLQEEIISSIPSTYTTPTTPALRSKQFLEMAQLYYSSTATPTSLEALVLEALFSLLAKRHGDNS